MIYICPYRLLDDNIAQLQPTHVITLLGKIEIDEIKGLNHLRVKVDDFSSVEEALTYGEKNPIIPSTIIVANIIQYLQNWNKQGNLLIHCLAGISRSTATALLAACIYKQGQEEKIVRQLRDRSKYASPNVKIIEIGDQLLGLNGRLIKALKQIEPALPAKENIPFSLDL